MKKTKRLLALGLSLVMSCTLLAGCGGEKDAADKNEQGQTVINVGGWPDKEGKELDTINARKDRFE